MKPQSTIGVYKPDFLDIILANARREKARKRVQVSGGRYFYTPSEEYRRFISHKVPLLHKKP
jgi:hypothetical protein